MTDDGKVNMEIKIGDRKVMLTVPFLRQDFVRDTETEIGRLLTSMRNKFPNKDERDLLAMIVYQYASYYRDLLSRHEEALRLASEIDRQISDLAEL